MLLHNEFLLMGGFTWWWIAYPALGLLVGFMAGLLGVGGGLLTVPLLLIIHQGQGIDSPHGLKVVLGTSMACIAFTSFSSMRSHQRQGNVRWDIFYMLTPGLIAGVFLGGLLVAYVWDKLLVGIFLVFALYTAMQMLFNWKVSPHRGLPAWPVVAGVGGITGMLSAMISAGGGFITVPFLSWCNVDMKRAVATSAACGFPIAVMGAISYMVGGYGLPNLPAHSVGFVHYPSTLAIALTSVFSAHFGAKVSSQMPVAILKKCFALMLVGIVAMMFNRYYW